MEDALGRDKGFRSRKELMMFSNQEYLKIVRSTAKNLGVAATERAILDHCLAQIDSIVSTCRVAPKTLDHLLGLVTSQIDLDIREIASKYDLKKLWSDIPPSREPVIATVPKELDHTTDAIVIRRSNKMDWERSYLAIINCMGNHVYRKYFSKWHEIAHLFIEGRQMTFAFRRTTISERQRPLERLVDRLAAQLAFYPSIFKPVLEREIKSAGRLTFSGIETIKRDLSQEASRLAVTMACVQQSNHPITFVQLGMGLRKKEQNWVDQPGLFPDINVTPEKKLRAKVCISNEDARKQDIQTFLNKSVSESSIVVKAFTTGMDQKGEEDFSLWRDDGPKVRVHVEAIKRGDEVKCLIQKV